MGGLRMVGLGTVGHRTVELGTPWEVGRTGGAQCS